MSTNPSIQHAESLLSQAEVKRQAALSVVERLDEVFAAADRRRADLFAIAGDAFIGRDGLSD